MRITGSSSNKKLEKDKVCSNVSSVSQLNDGLSKVLKTKVKKEETSSIGNNLGDRTRPFANQDIHSKYIMSTSKGQEISSSIKEVTDRSAGPSSSSVRRHSYASNENNCRLNAKRPRLEIPPRSEAADRSAGNSSTTSRYGRTLQNRERQGYVPPRQERSQAIADASNRPTPQVPIVGPQVETVRAASVGLTPQHTTDPALAADNTSLSYGYNVPVINHDGARAEGNSVWPSLPYICLNRQHYQQPDTLQSHQLPSLDMQTGPIQPPMANNPMFPVEVIVPNSNVDHFTNNVAPHNSLQSLPYPPFAGSTPYEINNNVTPSVHTESWNRPINYRSTPYHGHNPVMMHTYLPSGTFHQHVILPSAITTSPGFVPIPVVQVQQGTNNMSFRPLPPRSPHQQGSMMRFVNTISSSPPVHAFFWLPDSRSSRLDSQSGNYETMFAGFGDGVGDNKRRGLSKTEIESLPSFRYADKPEEEKKASKGCVICMSDFEDIDCLRVLMCKHEFHTSCIDRWLKTNRTCPICRGDAIKK
ncbi:RING finger protein 44 [Trichoplax sp. H2]|nr:RING finger protein 44 [Trichoplax sp. H2]|eukprot:RDD40564.1 RING finger protein 44 [Trichoplax sp. H2]